MPSGLHAMIVGAAVLALGAAHAQAREAYEWPTNMDLLRGALDRAAQEIVRELPDSVNRAAVTVGNVPLTTTRAYIVRAAVVEALLERGAAVATGPSPQAELEIAVHRMSVTIPTTHRRWLVGSRWADREAQVALSVTLRTNEHVTVWAADGEARASDSVPATALPWCAGPAELGLAPEMPEPSWVRVAEPVLVMSAVAAVIYLFFTQ